jgi:putative ABC transport system permease protein
MHPFGNWRLPVDIAGSSQQDARPVVVHQVSGQYTEMLGIALLQGRLFSDAEMYGRRHLAVVNQAFVRRYFAGQEPLGRGVDIPRMMTPPFNLTDGTFQIIGIVRDTLNRSLRNEVQPELYIPYTVTGLADRLVVLTQGPATVTNAVRSQVYALDKDQPVTEVRTMQAMLILRFSGPRFSLVLFTIFAALRLSLAVIGVWRHLPCRFSAEAEIGVRLRWVRVPAKSFA